jgi:hypothetical protein
MQTTGRGRRGLLAGGLGDGGRTVRRQAEELGLCWGEGLEAALTLQSGRRARLRPVQQRTRGP